MTSHYEPRAVEPRWQDRWERQRSGEIDLRFSEGKEYMLSRLRPSEEALRLRDGRASILGDVLFRFHRMNGRKVFLPMDWDAFGPEVEEAAAGRGIHPRDLALANVKAIKERLRRWGVLRDGSKEIISCQPEVYRWSQWLFLRLLERKLAYHAEGRWFCRLGEYAGPLLAGLDDLPEWPEGIKAMQRHLIASFAKRDWMISRPARWGTPIPVVHCPSCGAVPVTEKELPVELPKDGSAVTCPRCGGAARREMETMDPAIDSAWICLRHLSPRDSGRLVDPDLARRWMPVDLLVQAPALLPLLHARFLGHVLHDLELAPAAEPFARVLIPGRVTGWLPAETGEDDGADVDRVGLLSLGPLDQDVEWSDETAGGARRFLRRVWRTAERLAEALPTAPADAQLERHRQLAIRRVTASLRRLRCHTAVSALIDLSHAVARAVEEKTASKLRCDEAFDTLLQLLHPLAPHITEELWERRGHIETLLETSWPEYDEGKLGRARIRFVVQVDGKLRDRIDVDSGATEKEARTAVLARPKVQERLAGREMEKIHFVPDRLINLVTRRSA